MWASFFSANSAEESGGDGIRQLMEDFKGRVREVVSFDGNYDFIYDRALGAGAYTIAVKTEGGHAYNYFGNRNAIHVLSSMIGTLYNVKVPEGSGMSYNVGMINGGRRLNAIAESAEMQCEYRAVNKEDLAWLDDMLKSIVAAHRYMCKEITIERIGGRGLEGKRR